MALDSESRWRLVRAMRAKGEDAREQGEVVIRDAVEADLIQVTEIYNYYVQNSVVTFDLEKLATSDWQEKFAWLKSLD
ncbi:MAG: N-acetyltransferase family protein, partial [Phenylobacterium zucineum]